MTPNDDPFKKMQEQLRDGIIRDNANDYLSLTDFSMQPQPKHIRRNLTGQARNDAEASYLATGLRTLLEAQQAGNSGKVATMIATTSRYLDELEGQLHVREKPMQVAFVNHTATGLPRTTTESIAVAAENMRRSVVAGRLDHAREYLDTISKLIVKQNRTRNLMRRAAQQRHDSNEG